jgi:tetratricopeptide (TPR) repeat protein
MVAFVALFVSLALSPQSKQPRINSSAVFDQTTRQAEQARHTNRLDDAITFYSQAVRLRPAWTEGWWSLGSILYDQDRFPEARIAFSEFVRLSPRPGPAYAFLALCEYENRDYDRALLHFQLWSKVGSPGDDALLDVAGYHWALLLTRKGKFSEALYLLAAKAQKLGDRPALVEAMGLASLRIPDLPEEYPPNKREQVLLAGKAALYAARTDWTRADDYAGRLASHYSGASNVHYFLGTVRGFENRLPEAEKEYKKEMQISMQHVPAMVELSLVLIKDFRTAEAVTLAERAVALDPDNARARYAFGKSLLDIGRLRESVDELELAKQLAPGSAPVRSALASAYRQLGRSEEAKREAAIFLSLKDKESLGPIASPGRQKASGRQAAVPDSKERRP